MGDLYIFDLGDSEEGRTRREESAALRRQVRDRWSARLAADAGLDAQQAELAIAVLFDHINDQGDTCGCSCHPRFDTLHDGGFDCPCSWDAGRRAKSRADLFEALAPTPEELAHEAWEEAALAAWFAAHPGVVATRTCLAAPEVWEGTIDGRSFYFRERHDEWRIEIDLAPDGHVAQRWVGTDDAGEPITEPVELTSGPVIAQGLYDELGEGATGHLDLIVRKVRDYLRAESCTHVGARRFCADCGVRLD